jgi:uncharacterized protein YeaO (DUF488 family)
VRRPIILSNARDAPQHAKRLDRSLWLKEIAPSDDLRRWFGHDPARFAEFSRRYRAEFVANQEAIGDGRE